MSSDSRESAPSPMLPHGGPCTKRGHADYVGCSCLRQRATDRLRPRASDGLQSEASSVGAGGTPASWSRAQRLVADILKSIIKA